jgi:hypothetical protein
VWSPQYSLWLVPLAVLALPRWRLLLTWMVIDALLWAPRMYYYLTPANKGLPPEWFLSSVLIRDAMVVLLCVLVVRSILFPAEDLVRSATPGVDDPEWPTPPEPAAEYDDVGAAAEDASMEWAADGPPAVDVHGFRRGAAPA